MKKQVAVLPVERLNGVFEHEDGNIIISFEIGDLEQFGVLLAPSVADELTGALIEQPGNGYRELGSLPDEPLSVADHSIEQSESDSHVFRFHDDDGKTVTLQMGGRRLRRIRDAMTACLVKQERKNGTQ